MPSLSTTLPSPIPDAPALPPADAPASTYPPTGPAVARRRSSSIKHPHPHAHPHLVVGQAAVSYPPPPRKPLTPTGYVPAFESDDEMFKERYIALQLLINELEDENNLIAYRIAKEESRMRQLGLPLPNYAFSGPPNPPPVPEVVTQGALPAEPHSAEDVPRGREGEISARGTASNGVSGMEREEPRGVLPESRRVVSEREFVEGSVPRHEQPFDQPNGTKRRRESGDIDPRSISPSTHSYPPTLPSHPAARSPRRSISSQTSESRRVSAGVPTTAMDIDGPI
ncbi:hypothetical protein L202_07252 [Cryptococcus amylolentus CBS 6039]|uniref:Uncharacterized protein n=1 Tax=Cryptococcus amylolentus CBS 6039 TaxID=1295533 RepID=A0A1E3HBI5_9TREE|nr:hypothetical protein L202_07252 [Cryptococcus amylolentus CBS 6039]ODN73709.1 hypothetical protein L202_07252 [Cryptococcus amylolentus CBS 6039]